MNTFLLLVIGALLLALWLQRRRRRADWQAVGSILDAIVEGKRPSSFILHGAPAFRRLSLGLESLADQRDRLRQQISQEGFNLQTLLSSMADGVMIVDPAFQIRLVNTAFLTAFSLRTPPLGRSILQATRNREVDQAVRAAAETGQPQSREILLAAGNRHFLLNATPVRDTEGQPLGVAAILHDITRLKQLEQMRRDFVANVSHELRTPLSIFQGYLELLVDQANQPAAERMKTVQILQRHSGRLNALVEDLLTLARLEQRHGGFEPEQLAVEPLLAGVKADWDQKYAEKGVALRLAPSPGRLPPIQGETLRLEQVLNNLLENALNYTPPGGSVTLDAAAGGDLQWVEIRVSDTGSGIAASDLPHIFERFYRADKARSRTLGGTGLGLAIVKHIVLLHAGSVHAESSPGVGTTIFVRLPAAPRETEKPPFPDRGKGG